MKIKNLFLFLATLSVTISVNFGQSQLVNANEGKIIQKTIETIGPELGEKGLEYIFSLVPVQILTGIFIIIGIVWGIYALISYINNR